MGKCRLCNSAPATVTKDGTEMCESCRERDVLDDLEIIGRAVEEDRKKNSEFRDYLDGVSNETEYLAQLRRAFNKQRRETGNLALLGTFAAETQRRMEAGTDEQFLRSCGIKP